MTMNPSTPPDDVHRQRQAEAQHKGPPSMAEVEADDARRIGAMAVAAFEAGREPEWHRRRELEIGTRACLHWAEAAKRWARAGYKLAEIPDEIIVETWHECCDLAEREIDTDAPRHDERNDEMNSDRIYQAQRERGEA